MFKWQNIAGLLGSTNAKTFLRINQEINVNYEVSFTIERSPRITFRKERIRQKEYIMVKKPQNMVLYDHRIAQSNIK